MVEAQQNWALQLAGIRHGCSFGLPEFQSLSSAQGPLTVKISALVSNEGLCLLMSNVEACGCRLWLIVYLLFMTDLSALRTELP